MWCIAFLNCLSVFFTPMKDEFMDPQHRKSGAEGRHAKAIVFNISHFLLFHYASAPRIRLIWALWMGPSSSSFQFIQLMGCTGRWPEIRNMTRDKKLDYYPTCLLQGLYRLLHPPTEDYSSCQAAHTTQLHSWSWECIPSCPTSVGY